MFVDKIKVMINMMTLPRASKTGEKKKKRPISDREHNINNKKESKVQRKKSNANTQNTYNMQTRSVLC